MATFQIEFGLPFLAFRKIGDLAGLFGEDGADTCIANKEGAVQALDLLLDEQADFNVAVLEEGEELLLDDHVVVACEVLAHVDE